MFVKGLPYRIKLWPFFLRGRRQRQRFWNGAQIVLWGRNIISVIFLPPFPNRRSKKHWGAKQEKGPRSLPKGAPFQ